MPLDPNANLVGLKVKHTGTEGDEGTGTVSHVVARVASEQGPLVVLARDDNPLATTIQHEGHVRDTFDVHDENGATEATEVTDDDDDSERGRSRRWV